MANGTPYLSKSRFIKGLQCHKALWLLTHSPQSQDVVSASQQATFDAGSNVGILAQRLFPGGVEIPFDGLSVAQQLRMTRDEIEKGATTIYEAAFSFDNVFVKVDILHKGRYGWELHEVKASTETKEVYLHDIAVQYYVVAGAGIPVTRAALVHINNQYVREGDIDVHDLFTIQDVTETIQGRQTDVVHALDEMRAMLQKEMPVVDIGPYCDNPYRCSFHDHCWSHIPSPSVFDFAGQGKPDVFPLYRQGIIKMEDVPRESLGWRQQLQYDGTIFLKNSLDATAIRAFLDTIRYPLYFMDFETTCMIPVPPYNGVKPYQPVPFQFSLHFQHSPDAPLQHTAFLGNPDEDPQEPFLNALLHALPEDACIIVWNQGFEKKILTQLSQRFPDCLDYIDRLKENIIDLMVPFREKLIYHWQFNGSYSIKAVLPALIHDMDYANLGICDGGMASDGWMRMVASSSEDERAEIRSQLLEYCHMDTLAMVKILEKLKIYTIPRCDHGE